VIVADVSVVVDFLLGAGSEAGDRFAEALATEPVAVPHLLDVEVGHVLRRFVRHGEFSQEAALDYLAELADLPLDRYPHTPLLRRAFELRDNTTMYDAVYLALAEALDVPLLTADSALAAVPGSRAEVVLLASSAS
jgi:predicted nucleic acid-binding protein